MSDYQSTFNFNTAPRPTFSETPDITLNAAQTIAFKQALDVLSKYPGIMNTSKMGAGKTYWTVAIAIALKLPMLIICPPPVVPVWEKITLQFGIETLSILTYQVFAGMSTRGTRHSFLTRHGDVWEPTDELLENIEKGMLFVMDESHRTKNETASFLKPCHVTSNLIAKAFYRSSSKSRIIALSGTPGDKKKHVGPICQILGLCEEKMLVKYDLATRDRQILGLQEIIDHAEIIDPEATRKIVYGVEMTAENARKAAFLLYTEVIKHKVTVDMPLPQFNVTQRLFSGHFQFLPQDLQISKVGERMLKEQVEFKGGKWVMRDGRDSLGEVNKALQLIEWSKLNACARKGIEFLSEDPDSKLVIFVWHKASINYLLDQFVDYHPGQFSGMNKKVREKVLAEFMRPDNRMRVLIVSAKVGAMGVSMDDQSEGGKFKRNFMVIPNYEFTMMEQAFGRFLRGSTTSDSNGYVVFNNEFLEEEAMLRAVFDKGSTCSKFLSGMRTVGLNENNEKLIEPSTQLRYVPKRSNHIIKAVVSYYKESGQGSLIPNGGVGSGYNQFLDGKQSFHTSGSGNQTWGSQSQYTGTYVPSGQQSNQQNSGYTPGGNQSNQTWRQDQNQQSGWQQSQNQTPPPYSPPQQDNGGFQAPQQNNQRQSVWQQPQQNNSGWGQNQQNQPQQNNGGWQQNQQGGQSQQNNGGWQSPQQNNSGWGQNQQSGWQRPQQNNGGWQQRNF